MQNVLAPAAPPSAALASAAPAPSAARDRPAALLWTGRILTGLIATFLLVDGAAKLVPLAPVVEATRQLGYPVEVIRPLGLVLVASTLLHLFRRSELVGAVLLTAYLGGATATHVRVGTPLWFSVAMGVVLWAAFCMRRPRLRALLVTPSAA